MKRDYFRVFESRVERADANDMIWWEGHSWLNLTTHQVGKISEVLNSKGCIRNEFSSDGKRYHILPSGIRIDA